MGEAQATNEAEEAQAPKTVVALVRQSRRPSFNHRQRRRDVGQSQPI